MTARSTNQVDMSVFPIMDEYPLRLWQGDDNDSAIANDHRVDDCIRPFSWNGCTNDAWMRRPSGETDSVQLDRGLMLMGQPGTGQSQRSSPTEPMNNPRTHRITNTRSCSTENTK